LTQGLINGRRHFPAEIERLDALGRDNYARMRRAFAEYEIDADFAPVGTTAVATRPHEIDGLAEWASLEKEFGYDVQLLDADQAKEQKEFLQRELDGLKDAQNQLGDEETYALVIDDKADLAGLPDSQIAAAAAEAERRGQKGKWVIANTRSATSSETPCLRLAPAMKRSW